ncbi:hypothetical protein [Rubinisphaera italica]|uniref:hypothetical protein n=1 Tax=Rubinisphaera italica TaxID=2527969 RepID=UPI0011B72BF4|nr:hypothetical protein [Rubinisphaera italica]
MNRSDSAISIQPAKFGLIFKDLLQQSYTIVVQFGNSDRSRRDRLACDQLVDYRLTLGAEHFLRLLIVKR